MCCGQKMTELVPGTSDGAHEKHVPVVTIDGDKVTVEVGSVEHPMVEAHYIQWIAIETTKGSQRAKLEYTDKPRAEFKLAGGEELVAAYEQRSHVKSKQYSCRGLRRISTSIKRFNTYARCITNSI